VIIALSSTRLLCLRITHIGGEASEPELRIDAAPLTPETAIEIEATLEFRAARAGFLALTWTLNPAGGNPLTFTTLRPLGDYHSYYAGGDQVMVAAAKILGWPVPGAG
jgi:hypothetical protein